MKTLDTDIITRCPQCKTAFRAPLSVLKVANGTVRCGSCLRVFDAREHQLNKPIKEDESWALKLLEEEKKYDKKQRHQQITKKLLSNNLDISDTSIIDELEEDIRTHNTKVSTEPVNKTYIETPDTDTNDNILLEQIELDPISLEENKHSFPWTWFLGVVLMALILTTQIFWLRFDVLSQQPPYNKYYTIVCQYLSCETKPPVDISRIKTTQLIVRSHAIEKNALSVDAIIINNATFEQPYPALKLIFFNIHGTKVAGRTFQPDEYLKGELAGMTIMPTNQPIQLSLAIIDPGESAINYQIDATLPLASQ